MLLDDLRLEAAFAVARRTYLDLAKLCGNRLRGQFTVAAITGLLVLRIVLSVSQMGL